MLTNEAQPPNTLVTRDNRILKVCDRNEGQKWLGRILTASGSMMCCSTLLSFTKWNEARKPGTKAMACRPDPDPDPAYRWILQDKTTSINSRLKYFNVCVSTVVCFGGGHRTPYKKITKQFSLDVFFRKLCRSIVTPPSDTGWSLEWHEILNHWNDRARALTQEAGGFFCILFVSTSRISSAQCKFA